MKQGEIVVWMGENGEWNAQDTQNIIGGYGDTPAMALARLAQSLRWRIESLEESIHDAEQLLARVKAEKQP